MMISKEKVNNYVTDVYKEMERRGIDSGDIPRVISKTGFMSAINDYPEEQLHYSVTDAVDEILVTAAKA